MHEPEAPAITGIVLAGGRSSRMGRDKASIVFDGETLLQRTVRALAVVADEIIVVRAPGARLPAIDAPCPVVDVEDPVGGEGPLVGMAAGLAAVRAPVAIVVGVDMPFLQPALLRLLVERLLVERVRDGSRWVLPIADRRPQPLCSVFARDALEVLHAHIAAGDRAPMAVAADLRMARLEPEAWRAADPEGLSFMDIDTPEDFAAALVRLAAAGGGEARGR